MKRTNLDVKAVGMAALDLFGTCTAEELRALEKLTTPVMIEKGRVLCREGSAGTEAFVIIEGEAAVEIEGHEIAQVHAGDIVGEMAILDGGPRVATVTATTPMRVHVLSRGEFERALQVAPSLTRRLLARVGQRLRDAESG